ncbi:hypothetical protein AB0M00_19705 [Streptomyces chartreusis]|uniref:hypothetical protein n=1 Tax=Streptomyces chartreusis TaxID=1969 RepID=UPI00343ED745
MRAQRAVDVLSGPVAAVGAALVLHGLPDDGVGYRAGIALLVIGIAGLINRQQRRHTARLMAHQAEVAALSVAERWRYAEMGWKAAKFDSLDEETQQRAGDAQVYNLPGARAASEARRDGSA